MTIPEKRITVETEDPKLPIIKPDQSPLKVIKD
jgi:hypothetical protein